MHLDLRADVFRRNNRGPKSMFRVDGAAEFSSFDEAAARCPAPSPALQNKERTHAALKSC
jgi:hypothetical protein